MRTLRTLAVVGFLLTGLAADVGAQIPSGGSLPATCTIGDKFLYTGVTPNLLVACPSTNIWTLSTVINTPNAMLDDTINNANASAHGFLPKLSGSASDVLHGDGTWGPAAAGGIPAGLITVIVAGTCPATWTEVSALNGKMLRGTVAANGDVGTSAGSDSITPTGTVSQPTFTGGLGTVPAPVFTGSSATSSAVSGGTPAGTVTAPVFTGNALATHAHELPFQIASTTIFRQIAAATFGTGTSRAATSTVTHTANTTSAAVALTQAVTAGTPAGTNSVPTFTGAALATHTHTLTATGTNGMVSFTPAGTVSQPTFSGAAFNNRPAYTSVIFCQKS